MRIANAGDDCGSTKGAEQSAFMNGDACVSRHVRLVVMYHRFTVRDKQGGVWHSFQVFQAAYWGHHFVSHNKTWPAVINRML